MTDYPTPAGGCLLTDPIYGRRLQDLLRANPDPDDMDLTDSSGSGGTSGPPRHAK